MTQLEFTQQIRRLEKLFDTKYGEERAAILWKDVCDLSGKWFESVIDHLIASSRNMPLPAEFRDHIFQEKDRIREIEKRSHGRDAREFFGLTYNFPNEELREISKTIIEKIKNWDPSRGEDPKEEQNYQSYIRMLNNAANSKKGNENA